jgi:4,5-dihydroxyphthalate decarboxylase
VKPEGIDLKPFAIPIAELFLMIVKENPFDVAELALTEHIWDFEHQGRWIAIPVFPGWVFSCHTETLVNKDSGIETPEDLRGKRVGIPEYGVAAITWIRYAFESEYGVRPQEILWFEERTERHSQVRAMGWKPPADLRVQIIPEEKRLSDMLIAGEIDAVTRYFGRPRDYAKGMVRLDRSNIPLRELGENPKVRWLYPDRKAAAIEYHRKIGYLQPIHCVIIKKEIVAEHPWAPLSLQNSLARALPGPYGQPMSYSVTAEEQASVIGKDFRPAGLRRHRRAVEDFLERSKREGFASNRLRVEDLFHESTLDE